MVFFSDVVLDLINHLSVREYLIRRRMTLAARELWENPEEGIMDVALEYGYNMRNITSSEPEEGMKMDFS